MPKSTVMNMSFVFNAMGKAKIAAMDIGFEIPTEISPFTINMLGRSSAESTAPGIYSRKSDRDFGIVFLDKRVNGSIRGKYVTTAIPNTT